MTCLEIWVKKDLEQVIKAHLIIAEAKEQVDFDNPVYKTGILFPRESLERFKKLLGGRYKVETDSDMANIVARKGEDLLKEIVRMAGKEAHHA